ncbi:MAG: hypothetical protein JST19_17835, partial [Bacteroidetes bacterium]|nr:hypothetical protein [Bacteroidota bacterium]
FAKRTAGNDRNGFLTHTFQPFWACYVNKERAEKEFFCSLSNICQYYDLNVPDVSNEAYPQNIYKAWQVTAERIQHIDKKMDCIILKDKRHVASIATVRQFSTDMTLYYIPARPLWNYVQTAKMQPLAEVVISIFAYLHQVAKIDWFTEPGSYLGGQYNYVEEMIHEDEYDYEIKDDDTVDPISDEDKAFRELQLGEIFTLKNAGHHLYRKIGDSETLTRMEEIVLDYSHNETRDNDWAILAIEFVQLYREYPERSFFDNIHPELYYPEIEERVIPDQYISFYWSGRDSLNDTIFDIINCELQEKGVTDEPITVEVFDILENKGTDNFGFETRLLALINRLVDLLNNNDYDNDERE